MGDEMQTVMQRVRAALKRDGAQRERPIPPQIPEPIARLVHSDIGLSELFAKRAGEMNMVVSTVYVGELHEKLNGFLQSRNVRKIAIPTSKFLDELEIERGLRSGGFNVKRWPDMTMDELYDGYDAAVTDVNYAVAETGTLVIKPSADHGRSLSLVPMIHVAIVQPKNFVADLIDLMEKFSADPDRSNQILISGPSKTADIEMNVVTGVHGPNVVGVFILQ